MGMARLLASCRAKMICMGLGDEIALPLKWNRSLAPSSSNSFAKEIPVKFERGIYFLTLLGRQRSTQSTCRVSA
jgi:hypothetical protein